ARGDRAVAAAGQQRAPIGEKRSRPDGQSRSDEGTLDLAPKSVENRNRAADAGGGDEAAIARQGHCDDRRLRRLDRAKGFTSARKQVDLAVRTGGDDLPLGGDARPLVGPPPPPTDTHATP